MRPFPALAAAGTIILATSALATTPSHAPRAAKAVPAAAAAKDAAVLTPGQLDAARRVYTGAASCEFDQTVHVAPIDGKPGHGYELVRRSWGAMLPAIDFEKAWRRVVHDGIHPETRYPAVTPSFGPGWDGAVAKLADAAPLAGGSMELIFSRGSGVHDGRFANLGWLVERSERSIWPAVLLHAVSNMAIEWLI